MDLPEVRRIRHAASCVIWAALSLGLEPVESRGEESEKIVRVYHVPPDMHRYREQEPGPIDPFAPVGGLKKLNEFKRAGNPVAKRLPGVAYDLKPLLQIQGIEIGETDLVLMIPDHSLLIVKADAKALRLIDAFIGSLMWGAAKKH